MSNDITCECGAMLVEEVTTSGVRPRGAAESIIFRRTTDHVVCDACFASYDVRALMGRATGEGERKLISIVDNLSASS